ncbi:MAG: flagellar protein [Butyrivibrio sp.]|nr:flagellar protein [Butyrivibrio sp.]
MIQNNSNFLSIEQVQNQYFNNKPKTSSAKPTASGFSFNQVLEQIQSQNQTEGVKFSKHAMGRLNDRNIELTDAQMDRLNKGMIQAGEKGINESLILVDQLAFIVNIPNNTVVTAMDQTGTDSNVFTNIDGAVIA